MVAELAVMTAALQLRALGLSAAANLSVGQLDL